MTAPCEIFKREDTGYYSGDTLLKLGAKINIVFGSWGNGKSYYYIHKLICKEVKSGRQVVYVRRTKDEAERNAMNLADIIQDYLPQEEVKFIRTAGASIIYVNKQPVIYCPNVRGGAMWKSFDLKGFPKVRWIVYDEFIPENKIKFNSEWEQWVRLVETFTRHFENKRIVMIGNTIGKDNTYYDHYFNLQGHDFPEANTINFYREDSFAVERAVTSDVLKKKKQGTSVGYMANLDPASQKLIYNADFVNPNDAGVRKNIPKLITAFYFNLCLRGVTFGLYAEGANWRIQEPKEEGDTYALSPLDSVEKSIPPYPALQSTLQQQLLSACEHQKITFRSLTYRDILAIWLSHISDINIKTLKWQEEKT